MFTHGTITGLLFVMVGLIYDRAHTRNIDELSGLAHFTPIIAVGMVMAGLASLGLPAMSGFVAEVTVFLGTAGRFQAPTIIAVFGIVLSAGYILWMVQRVFFGPQNPRWAALPDANVVVGACADGGAGHRYRRRGHLPRAAHRCVDTGIIHDREGAGLMLPDLDRLGPDTRCDGDGGGSCSPI